MIQLLVILLCLLGAANGSNSGKSCPVYTPPKNGALVCLFGLQQMCQVYCQGAFEFAYRPAELYFCSYGGTWNVWPIFGFTRRLPWPDCAEIENPESSFTRKMPSPYYYAGDCHDAEVQDEHRESFISIVSNPAMFPVTFCRMNRACTQNNLKIFCGRN